MSKNRSLQTLHQLDFIYTQLETLIDLLDDRAIAEMQGGSEKDLDKLLTIMEEEAISIFTSLPKPVTEERFFDLSYLTRSMDESLKVLNFNYFTVTMLPDFNMGWHNIEWGNLVQLYPYLCILAARSLGKSFHFSKALPIWKMYGYRRRTDSAPTDRLIELRKEGVLITNEFKLAKKLMDMIVEEIKVNDLLTERLMPSVRGEGSLGKEQIKTKNGCTLHLRSASSSPRGLHPGWFVVDDFLSESSLYSQEEREKVRNYFYSDIMKALEKRGGTINVIGCISPSTIVLTDNGLRTMGELSPLGAVERSKELVPFKETLHHNNGTDESSHYWYNGETETKRITLQFGYELECSQIHPLWVMNENGIPEWKQSKDISVGDYVGIRIGAGFGNAQAIDIPDTIKDLIGDLYSYEQLIFIVGRYCTGGIEECPPIVADFFELSNIESTLNKIMHSDSNTVKNFLYGFFSKKREGFFNVITESNAKIIQTLILHLGFLSVVHKNFIMVLNKDAASISRHIRTNLISGDNLVYLPVKSIEDGKCYTVDFHIPNSHKFLTNGILSHNTPFHERDLYYDLRNDHQFKFFEYPAIFPDGTITAPNRWDMNSLEAEYKSSGSTIFSRELLVVPVSDSSTIFPYDILNNAIRGMQNFILVPNRASFRMKFKYVTVGCDFAISGKIGSDASVFTVWGEDEFGCYWLLYVWRGVGKSHNEQIAKIAEIERNFQPDEIVAEKNGFQKMMLDEAYNHGVKSITQFNTDGWNKKDLREGLPGLAILFEQSRIRIPYGDMHSKEQADWLFGEFNTITIKPDTGKLESAGSHDDGPMSAWFGIKGTTLNKKKVDFDFTFV